ncbi:hypothetical protein J6590_041818 [Homalodisca vitripennis]|nr:hypothetical protein J6590_041818 [Homalodisca vitripennis]
MNLFRTTGKDEERRITRYVKKPGTTDRIEYIDEVVSMAWGWHGYVGLRGSRGRKNAAMYSGRGRTPPPTPILDDVIARTHCPDARPHHQSSLAIGFPFTERKLPSNRVVEEERWNW